MALFKILKGPSSRISQDTTEFHDGYAYFTPDDGGFYIDSEDGGEQRRIHINPKYEAGENAGQVEIDIDNNTHKISASVVAGGIGTDEIADANVTKEKLSTEVQSSLEQVEQLAEYVGDKPVTDQVFEVLEAWSPPVYDAVEEGVILPVTSNAVYNALENADFVYVQDEEPADAEPGALWVDTSEDAAEGDEGGGSSTRIDATQTQEGWAADAAAVGDAISGMNAELENMATECAKKISKAGAEMEGVLIADSVSAADLTVAQMRNIVSVDVDPGDGSTSTYPSGTVVLVRG